MVPTEVWGPLEHFLLFHPDDIIYKEYSHSFSMYNFI